MMAKERDVNTVAGAVMKIVKALGPEGLDRAATIVGKSEVTVRGWMDPDKDAEPGMTAMKKLDAAYYHETGLEPPLLKLYEDMISAETQGHHGSAKLNLWRELANIQIATARVPQAILDATHPDSPGGAHIVRHELANISNVGDHAKDSIDRAVLAARQIAAAGLVA